MSQMLLALPEPVPTPAQTQILAPVPPPDPLLAEPVPAPPRTQLPPPVPPEKPAPPHLVPRTVAEAITAVRGCADLSAHRRSTITSTLRAVARLAGKPAEAVRFDPGELLTLLERARPVTLGVKVGTFINYGIALRQVLRRFGLLAPERIRPQKADHPAWTELLSRLPGGQDFLRLRSFIGFCASEGIAPEEVGGMTLETYSQHRTATRGGGTSGNHARRVASQWNHASRDIEGWPAVRLGVTGQTLHRSAPFEAYPPGLQEGVAAYVAGIGAPSGGGGGLYTGPQHRVVKPSTVTNHRYNLRRLLWGAVQGGIPMAEIDSLDVVISTRFVKTALDWHYRRAGEQVTTDLGHLATTVASVAQYLELPPGEWGKLKALLKPAAPKQRTEMTERNAALLDKLDDPTIRAALLHAPSPLLKRAARLRDGWTDRKDVFHPPRPVDAGWLAGLAVAIEILLHAPLRRSDLQALRLGEELILTSRGRGRWSGTVRVATSKTGKLVEFPLGDETIARIRDYLENYRPALPNADMNWVFPGQVSAGRPREKASFATAITEILHDVIGIRVNPHAFRAFVGALILERNPHAIDDLRAVLGHSSLETALMFYRRNDQRAAAIRLSATVSQERRKTKRLAEAYFPDLERKLKSRRAPWQG